MRRWVVRMALPMVAAAVVLALLARSDLRFGYVLLILVLTVFPMAWCLLWISMTGRPWVTMVTRPQRWTPGKDDDCVLSVDFFPFNCDRENPGKPVLSMNFSRKDIEQSYSIKGYIVIRTRVRECPMLIAPDDIIKNY